MSTPTTDPYQSIAAKVYIEDGGSPCDSVIDLSGESNGILSSILGSSSQKHRFLDRHFQRHPFVIRGTRRRVSTIKDLLYSLDVKTMLENTASEQGIHVWVRVDGGNENQEKSIESLIIDDAAHALILYRAGHSIYCRAPAELEKNCIPQALKELGIGIRGCGTDRFCRGEIETFFSRRGHLTDYHTDFQENFTIQLSGKKRWSFRQSSAVAPIRGITPHFSNKRGSDVAEQQLKVMKVIDSCFSSQQYIQSSRANIDTKGIQPHNSEGNSTSSSSDPSTKVNKRKYLESNCSSDEPEMLEEVILSPGDVLYHPAGVWHRVECTEDSISINISLIAASYAEVFCSGLQQLLWGNPVWRAPVSTLTAFTDPAEVVVRTVNKSNSSHMTKSSRKYSVVQEGDSGTCDQLHKALSRVNGSRAVAVMSNILQSVPHVLDGLLASDFLPMPCFELIPKTLVSSSGSTGSDGDREEEEDDEEEEEEEEEEEDNDDEEEEEDEDDAIPPFVDVATISLPSPPDTLDTLDTLDICFRLNPLAQILSVKELEEFGCDCSRMYRQCNIHRSTSNSSHSSSSSSNSNHSNSTGSSLYGSGEGGDDVAQLFVVHSSFGNETLESAARTLVKVDSQHLPAMKYLLRMKQLAGRISSTSFPPCCAPPAPVLIGQKSPVADRSDTGGMGEGDGDGDGEVEDEASTDSSREWNALTSFSVKELAQRLHLSTSPNSNPQTAGFHSHKGKFPGRIPADRRSPCAITDECAAGATAAVEREEVPGNVCVGSSRLRLKQSHKKRQKLRAATNSTCFLNGKETFKSGKSVILIGNEGQLDASGSKEPSREQCETVFRMVVALQLAGALTRLQ